MLVAAVYLGTGLLWTGLSLLGVIAQPEYWDPVTVIDWVAVWSYSVALGLLAIAVPLLARDARAGRLIGAMALTVGVAAVLAALGNLMEDAFDISEASAVYVVGAFGTMIGLLVLATALFAARRRESSLVAVLIAAGVVLQAFGLGVLVLVGGVLAARDHLSRQPQRDAAVA